MRCVKDARGDKNCSCPVLDTEQLCAEFNMTFCWRNTIWTSGEKAPLQYWDRILLYWVPCHAISQLLQIWFHCARVRASRTKVLRINSFAITFPMCSMTRTFDTIIFVLSSAARDEIWSNDADWINSIILPEALSCRAVFPHLFTMSVLAPYCSRSLMTRSWPKYAAAWRGVLPSLCGSSTEASFSRRNLDTS